MVSEQASYILHRTELAHIYAMVQQNEQVSTHRGTHEITQYILMRVLNRYS